MNISVWWAIPALTGLIGLVIFVGGVGHLFKLRMFSGLSRFLFGGVFLSGAVVATLFGMNLQTYARLTHERIAAEVTLEEVEPGQWRASVIVPDDEGVMGEPRYYMISGDAFRMDARFLKWRPWANVAGYDAVYRLDRIQGRYDDVADENATPPTAYDLAPGDRSAGLDIYELSRNNDMLKRFNAVDAVYGAGSYAPLANGAVYDMMATQSGLVPRPKNEAAKSAALQWGAPATSTENSVTITSGADAD